MYVPPYLSRDLERLTLTPLAQDRNRPIPPPSLLLLLPPLLLPPSPHHV
jgi:hypothetical protein